jgi:hypothetical protein
MLNQHPITPPTELVQQWADMLSSRSDQAVFTMAAQWGADQQLTEDAKWLDYNALNELHLRITPIVKSLQKAMHPQPPSLKEQALDELAAAERLYPADWSTIRRALEALDD